MRGWLRLLNGTKKNFQENKYMKQSDILVNFNNKISLIIGSSGFLGSHLIKKISESGQKYYCSSSNLSLVNKHQNMLYFDVTKPETINNLPQKIDIVYYTAMSPLYHNFPDNVKDVWDVNVNGLLLVLEYARNHGVQSFILASSGSIYSISSDMLTEESPLSIGEGCSFYASSKIAAEALINSYSKCFSICCLRLFFPYGKGLSDYMLFSRMVYNIQNELPIVLDGEDGFESNPVYIDDVVNAFIAASGLTGFHTINIAGLERISLGNICRIMGNLIGRKPNFVCGNKPWVIVSSIVKMTSLLCLPRVSINEGISLFINT